jgi:hypothetical protein
LAGALNANQYTRAAASAAVGTIASVAGYKIAGIDASFSWKGVAASAVTGALTAGISKRLGFDAGDGISKTTGQFGSDLANGLIGSVAGRGGPGMARNGENGAP